MSSEIFNELKKIEIKKIEQWSLELLKFPISPKKYLSILLDKDKGEIIKQVFFYLLLAIFFYLFILVDASIENSAKPMLLDFAMMTPYVVLLSLVSQILLGKLNLIKIIIYFFTLQIVFTPIAIILFTLFISGENYTFKLFLNIVTAISVIYIVFVSGYAISENKKEAIKLIAGNYVIINVIALLFNFINFDSYSSHNTLVTNDPIYNEYEMLIEPLKDKSYMPVQRLVSVSNGKYDTHLTFQDIIVDTVSQGGNNATKKFKRNNALNLEHINESLDKLQFRRNKEIALTWKNYFERINEELEIKIENSFELKEKEITREVEVANTPEFKSKIYLLPVDYGELLKMQFVLKDYHNNIITASNQSEIPLFISNIITLFLAESIDYVIYWLFDGGKEKVYKEQFLEFE